MSTSTSWSMLSTPPPTLRIACLEPSATAICLELGLKDYIVGVTHECHELVGEDVCDQLGIRILTRNGLTVTSQGDIHKAVQESVDNSNVCEINRKEIPSLYPLLQDELEAAAPTVVCTQDLCAVCAPTTADVRSYLLGKNNDQQVQVVSLQPTTLEQVAETFVTVAKACGVQDRGEALKEQWLDQFIALNAAVQQHRDESSQQQQPRMLILEWLDPPFDSGHWTYQMMEHACVAMAKPKKDVTKSKHIEWNQIYEMDPDVVVVGCCGFDLPRNIRDTLAHAPQLAKLKTAAAAADDQRIFACNGNIYIAQPGPALLQGAAILAISAYQDQPNVIKAVEELNIVDPKQPGWQKVDILLEANKLLSQTKTSIPNKHNGILDIEDLGSNDGCAAAEGFVQVHDAARQEGKQTYIDPETGYQVFTELAHKHRGYCCGSGCRHCPYSHENVKDKASRIQQPAVLFRQLENDDDDDDSSRMFSLNHHSKVKVLFFSGGKDSFLTIRSLVQSYRKSSSSAPFGLVLLTTFDAASRIIAHQEVPIDEVIRQATHLNISLVGIPLRRGSGEPYVERIRRGLEVVETNLLLSSSESDESNSRITTLVFGDLHLEHIRDWRDNAMAELNMDLELEYPLWKKPYLELLDDLEASQVPCCVAASTVDSVQVGTMFTREFYNEAISSLKVDGFGETGEFHSLAKVWEVPRRTALGLLNTI